MKVILSRKGFDSSYGGYPSLILPDKRMVTLPIPDARDQYTYSDLLIDGKGSVMDYMKTLSPNIKCSGERLELDGSTRCHLDPDINYGTLSKRDHLWRGAFGQKDAAQTVLEKNGVSEGDLFLFFGWFSHFPEESEKVSLTAYRNSGFHALFGYLQIGEIFHTSGGGEVPDWLSYHPHMTGYRRESKNNCIYIARDHVSWDKNIPGYGSFRFDDGLKLSVDDLSRSKWRLPEFFRELKITYHSPDSWKDGYFQSACIGQEFVVEENRQVSEWAKALIGSHHI